MTYWTWKIVDTARPMRNGPRRVSVSRVRYQDAYDAMRGGFDEFGDLVNFATDQGNGYAIVVSREPK